MFSLLLSGCVTAGAQQSWRFAVSGDSRNCGDVVMPLIAKSVQKEHADFYWHLGDFRAGSDFDEDMKAASHGTLTISQYEAGAWKDFIDHQLASFDGLPVFLGIGNHELVNKTRTEFLVQFADWFNAPVIQAQRAADNPSDHTLRTYYHWRHKGVDFVTLDNASQDQLSLQQVLWFEGVLARDAADPQIKTVVVGAHEALPDSLSAGHSMNESPAETASGRRAYRDLLAFQKQTHKEVHVIASHSHFVLSDVFRNACHKPDEVLNGWIVGSAGAVRYRLPKEHSNASLARTDVYGYLLGEVDTQGHVALTFHEVKRADVTKEIEARYGTDTVNFCFNSNKGSYQPEGPSCAQ